MDTKDFSNQWDVLWNNIASNQAPGLNEYEKSVFLTKAQNQLVVEYFNQRVDQVGGGFDGSQKRQYDFSSLIKTSGLPQVADVDLNDLNKVDKRSICYVFPFDYFLSVNEQLSDSRYQYSVLPLSYDEYMRLMQKPYAYPVKKAAWRLITGQQHYYTASDTHGNTLRAMVNSNVNLGIGYAKIADTSDSSKWYGRDPFVAIANTSASSIPAIDAPIIMQNGLVCKPSAGLQTYLYLEVFKASATYQVRLFSIGAAAMNLKDGAAMTFISEIIENYVKANPDENTLYHEFYRVFGDFKGSTIKASGECFKLDIDSITSYTNGYSTSFNGEVFNFKDSGKSSPMVEVIGKFAGVPDYTLRYIKKPAPIILVDLVESGYEDLNIEGVQSVSECELPEETHQEILERAVTLAKIAWAGGTATQAARQSNNN